MVKIQVPATSANLGAGFDSLGIALKMYNIINMEEYDGIDISSKDDVFVPLDRSNLIYASAKKLYRVCGKPFHGLKIEQQNNIPMSRGLGSSSACIAAGLVGANKLLGNPMKKEELIDYATKIEGHPDNVVPAILGGLTVSVLKEDKVYCSSIPVSGNLCFCAMIPPFEIKTSISRRTLKSYYSREDAVFNISRSALTVASLFTGQFENLKVSTEDRIHQPYRIRLIRGAKDIFDISYRLGSYGTYLSGSGSTVVSILKKEIAEDFKKNMLKEMKSKKIENWRLEILDIDYNGAKVIY